MALESWAPAKLTLFLRVGPRRADGLHELQGIFHPVALWDHLLFVPLSYPHLRVHLLEGQIPGGEFLIQRTLRRFQPPGKGMRVLLRKRIPVAAGLGGGSADAAATVSAIRRLWNVEPEPEAIFELGADIPACLEGGLLRVEGAGERLTRLPRTYEKPVLLIFPDFPVSTAEAYRWLDEHPHPGLSEDKWWEESFFFQPLPPEERNSFYPYLRSLWSPVREVEAILKAHGIQIWSVAGSGPTIFALGEEMALREAEKEIARKEMAHTKRTSLVEGRREREWALPLLSSRAEERLPT